MKNWSLNRNMAIRGNNRDETLGMLDLCDVFDLYGLRRGSPRSRKN